MARRQCIYRSFLISSAKRLMTLSVGGPEAALRMRIRILGYRAATLRARHFDVGTTLASGTRAGVAGLKCQHPDLINDHS